MRLAVSLGQGRTISSISQAPCGVSLWNVFTGQRLPALSLEPLLVTWRKQPLTQAWTGRAASASRRARLAGLKLPLYKGTPPPLCAPERGLAAPLQLHVVVKAAEVRQRARRAVLGLKGGGCVENGRAGFNKKGRVETRGRGGWSVKAADVGERSRRAILGLQGGGGGGAERMDELASKK